MKSALNWKTYQKLEPLTDKDLIHCLKKFNEHYSFTKWLRQKVRDVKAVKILADLASESENEGALEVVRVQSLTLVGTAYSPLIYDLKKECDHENLIELITTINKNLKKNPELASKLDAIVKEKLWLEGIIENKGNTGLNSLKQAQCINQNGVYFFGLNSSKIKKLKKDYTEWELNDIIELNVEIEGDDKAKTYNYKQLVNLNDKLTLVVGKAEEQQEVIRYFENIFEAIINMGEIYLELLKSGNILFKDWNATVYCDPESIHTIKVNFGSIGEGEESNLNIIHGYRDQEETPTNNYQKSDGTINSLNRTVKYLQNCYKKWLFHIEQKRNEFSNLNLFQINQINMMRTNIAKFVKESKNNKVKNSYDDLFDLFYNVNRSVDISLLKEANDYAFSLKTEIQLQQPSIDAYLEKELELSKLEKESDEERNLIEKIYNQFYYEKDLIRQGKYYHFLSLSN
jgi:hypothetical protein